MKKLSILCILVVAVVAVVLVTGTWSRAEEAANEDVLYFPEREDRELSDDRDRRDFHEEEAYEDDEYEWSDEREGHHEEAFDEERLELEMRVLRLESIRLDLDVAGSRERTVSLVVCNILDYVGEEDAISLLEETLSVCQDEVTQRLIRLRLAALYAATEQPSRTLDQLRALILAD